MHKIYADFNDRTADDGCWILLHDGADLAEQVSQLGLSIGDQVLLYQDESDFEVIATLDFKFVDALGRSGWVAYPDWSTLDHLPTTPVPAASDKAGRKVA